MRLRAFANPHTRGIYISAILGATAFEIQVHRLVIRILRPRFYFWPRRHPHAEA